MNRSGTALGVLMCTLAASLAAMGSARGAAKFAPLAAAKPTSRTAPDVVQVAYVMVLPASTENSHSAGYECGQAKTPHVLSIATELPALAQVDADEEAPYYLYTAESDEDATVPSDVDENTIRQLLKPAPAVLLDLDTSNEPDFSGDVIDWESAVYEKYLAETLEQVQIKWHPAVHFFLTSSVEYNVSELAYYLSERLAAADRWLAPARVSATYPAIWAGVRQAQLEREIAELFGDVAKPKMTRDTSASEPAVNDAAALPLKIEKQALIGDARALDQLGQSLQGISQRLERLTQPTTEAKRWSFPETAPRSSRVNFGESSR